MSNFMVNGNTADVHVFIFMVTVLFADNLDKFYLTNVEEFKIKDVKKLYNNNKTNNK